MPSALESPCAPSIAPPPFIQRSSAKEGRITNTRRFFYDFWGGVDAKERIIVSSMLSILIIFLPLAEI